jgi:hypothetical protein
LFIAAEGFIVRLWTLCAVTVIVTIRVHFFDEPLVTGSLDSHPAPPGSGGGSGSR